MNEDRRKQIEQALQRAAVGGGEIHIDLRKIGIICGMDLYINVGNTHDPQMQYENFKLAQDALFYAFIGRHNNGNNTTATTGKDAGKNG